MGVAPGRGHGRNRGSGRGRTWNGNRGHSSLDNLNARDRREILQWRKDKDELEKLRFEKEKQDDHAQNLEGIIWCMEDKEEELQKQIGAQQGILFQMSCNLKSMDEKATSLHTEKVELMKNRMAAESRALALSGELQKQGKEMVVKDAELQSTQESLKEKQAAHDEQLKCLLADFHTYQAHPGMQELMIVLQLLQPCLLQIALNALARARRKRRLQLCNVKRHWCRFDFSRNNITTLLSSGDDEKKGAATRQREGSEGVIEWERALDSLEVICPPRLATCSWCRSMRKGGQRRKLDRACEAQHRPRLKFRAHLPRLLQPQDSVIDFLILRPHGRVEMFNCSRMMSALAR